MQFTALPESFHMQYKGCVASVTACALLLSAGCSVFQPRQQSVTIIASEPGSQISVNNNPVGTSPVTIMLDRDKTYSVGASAFGRTGTAAIGRKVSAAGGLDIAGGILFLVPIIGVFTPGFWELDPTTVTVKIPTDSGTGNQSTYDSQLPPR